MEECNYINILVNQSNEYSPLAFNVWSDPMPCTYSVKIHFDILDFDTYSIYMSLKEGSWYEYI